jgi:hypothetical protein
VGSDSDRERVTSEDPLGQEWTGVCPNGTAVSSVTSYAARVARSWARAWARGWLSRS